MNTRAQRPGMRCREVFSPLGYGPMAVQRRPTMKLSAYHWPTPGKEALDRRVPSCSLSLLITTPVRHAAARKDSRLSLTAAVAVEMWKSRAFAFGAISKRGGKRGKVPVPSAVSLPAGRTFPRFPRRVISTASIQQPFPPRRSLVTDRQILPRLLSVGPNAARENLLPSEVNR